MFALGAAQPLKLPGTGVPAAELVVGETAKQLPAHPAHEGEVDQLSCECALHTARPVEEREVDPPTREHSGYTARPVEESLALSLMLGPRQPLSAPADHSGPLRSRRGRSTKS